MTAHTRKDEPVTEERDDCRLCDGSGIGQRQGTHCPECFSAPRRRVMTEED